MNIDKKSHKVEIISACYVDGKAYAVGDVVETNKSVLLIGTKKAIPYVEKAKPELTEKAPTKRAKRVIEPEMER